MADEERRCILGLDWMLLGPARSGAEQRRGDLFKRLANLQRGPADIDQLEAVAQELADVCVPASEVSGAPRVGEDPRADQWVRENVGPDAVAKKRGLRVPYLAPPDALAAFGASSGNPFDFRGQLVCSTLERFDKLMAEECYYSRDETEALSFASRLESTLTTMRKSEDYEKSSAPIAAAIRWMKFWGARGCGFHSWF